MADQRKSRIKILFCFCILPSYVFLEEHKTINEQSQGKQLILYKL